MRVNSLVHSIVLPDQNMQNAQNAVFSARVRLFHIYAKLEDFYNCFGLLCLISGL